VALRSQRNEKQHSLTPPGRFRRTANARDGPAPPEFRRQGVPGYFRETNMRSFSRRVTILVGVAAFAIGIPLGVVFAGATFSDVPPSNPFYNDITALANSGVTGGCGGGKFCPKDTVTREQMAAFMNRLGALSPTKTPVVNADKVDGLDSTVLLLGTAPIPAGTTVTGYDSYDYAVVADNQDVIVSVQLPAPAPVDLTAGNVNFAPDALVSDGDASCTGTVAAPTAPAGKVCLYLGESGSVDGGGGYSAEQTGFMNRAFLVLFNTDSTTLGADLFFRFTWAYTAPTAVLSPGTPTGGTSKD
jgi:S-layer homology domain